MILAPGRLPRALLLASHMPSDRIGKLVCIALLQVFLLSTPEMTTGDPKHPTGAASTKGEAFLQEVSRGHSWWLKKYRT